MFMLHKLEYFQFPNGFSRYYCCSSYQHLLIALFQFPNGFSLSDTDTIIQFLKLAFQFPNGFSHSIAIYQHDYIFNFQFPNGFSLSLFTSVNPYAYSTFNSLTDSHPDRR
mgnify:CR=1 FL=1